MEVAKFLVINAPMMLFMWGAIILFVRTSLCPDWISAKPQFAAGMGFAFMWFVLLVVIRGDA